MLKLYSDDVLSIVKKAIDKITYNYIIAEDDYCTNWEYIFYFVYRVAIGEVLFTDSFNAASKDRLLKIIVIEDTFVFL